MNSIEHVRAKEYFETLRSIFKEDLGGSGSALRSFIRENRAEHDRYRALILEERSEMKAIQDEASISLSEKDALKEAIVREMQSVDQPEVVIWANQQLDYFTNAAAAVDPREKKRRIDRVTTICAEHLLQSMDEMDVAISTWRSKNGSKDSTDIPFHEQVSSKLVELIEKRWEKEEGKMSPEPLSEKDLATLISVYTHSPLASETTERILREYFIGAKKSVEKPKGSQQQESYQTQVRSNRIHAMYNFACAAFELVGDPPAFKKALEILLFGNDNVLPLHADYIVDYMTSLNSSIDPKQIPVMQKALLLFMILPSSATIMGLDEVSQRFNYFAESDSNVIGRVRICRDFLVAKYGSAAVRNHTYHMGEVMRQYLSRGLLGTQPQAIEWPYNVFQNTADKLSRKYLLYIAPEASSHQISEQVTRLTRENLGERELVTISLKVPGDDKLIISTVVPKTMLPQISSVLQRCIENYSSRTDERTDLLNTPFFQDGMTMRVMTGNVEVDKTKLYFWIRPAGEREDNQHELLALQAIGFPRPYIDQSQNLTDVNVQLAKEIAMAQLRFPNKRGYRVPLDRTQLGQYGYTSVDFMKDPDRKDRIIVKFNLGKVSFSVKLNRYFMFDFEGKTFPNVTLHESVQHTVLQLLKPILCDPSKEIEDQPELEETRTVVSRVGHLMLLPKGRYYSATAVKNCWIEENRDLQQIDKERQVEALKKAEKAMDEGDLVKAQEWLDRSERITTYVRPVRSEAEQYALPVTVFIDPNTLVFGSN